MRCVLHIGTEKTGSTAIQQFLYLNRMELKKNGVHVCTSMGEGNNRALPAAFTSEDRSDDFHEAMNYKGSADRRAWKKKALDAFTKEISKAQSGADVFVISSEHFHSRLLSPEEVEEFHSFLAPLFEDIDIICYLRRQDQLALSRYSQALRAGHVPASPFPKGVFKRKNNFLPPYLDFQSLLQRWANAFGEHQIKPRVFSPDALLDGDIVHDFLAATGISSAHTVELKREKKNVALSAEAQAILLGVNKNLKEYDARFASELRDKLVEYLQESAPGKSVKPSAARAQEFYGFFEASNNTIAKRWFKREKLFDTDFSDYPDKATGASTDKVVEILSGFLLQQRN